MNRQLYLTLLFKFLVDLKLYNLIILNIIILCILCLERAALSFLAKTNSVGTAEDVNVLGFFRPHNSLAGSKQSGVKCALQTNEWLAYCAGCLCGYFVRVLGCHIHPAGTQDWGPLLGNLTTLVETWKVRHLSFQGRTVVANTLGLSTFLYLGSVCFVPPATVLQINRLVFPFI